MIEFLLQFKDSIIIVLEHMGVGFSIFIPTLAAVYIVGRMLNLAHSDTVKNLIALIVNYLVSYLYLFTFFEYSTVILLVWEVFYFGGIGILLYVLIGFTLAKRADNLLDYYFAPDDHKITKKKRKK